MTSVIDLIREAEHAGIRLRLDGETVKATLPKPPEPAAPIMARLRAHKVEVAAALAQRQRPALPAVTKPKAGAPAWPACPVHGAEHRPCMFSGKCGWECGCNLCEGWRNGMRWLQ